MLLGPVFHVCGNNNLLQRWLSDSQEWITSNRWRTWPPLFLTNLRNMLLWWIPPIHLTSGHHLNALLTTWYWLLLLPQFWAFSPTPISSSFFFLFFQPPLLFPSSPLINLNPGVHRNQLDPPISDFLATIFSLFKGYPIWPCSTFGNFFQERRGTLPVYRDCAQTVTMDGVILPSTA